MIEDRTQLTRTLVRELAEATETVHRLTRRRAALQNAITALRIGRALPVVLAHLAEDGVTLDALERV